MECLKASCVPQQTNLKPVPRNSWAGTLFHVVLVTSCQMMPALQLVLNHKLYLSFEDRTPHCGIRNQLDTSNYFIAIRMGSTCFEHYYAHHQELATMMLITTLVVSFLVCCVLEVGCGSPGVV